MAYDPSDFLPDDLITQDPVAQNWQMQAIKALDAGRDPVAVNKMLRNKLQDRGYDVSRVTMPVTPTKEGDEGDDTDVAKAVRNVWAAPNKETKSDYASAVVPQAIRDINSVKDSPNQFGRVEAGSDTTAGKDEQTYLGQYLKSLAQAGATGVRGLLDVGGSLAAAGLNPAQPGIPNQAAADEAFAQAQAIKDQQDQLAQSGANEIPTTAGKAGQALGGLGGGLLTMGTGVFSTPRDVLEDGGTPLQAWAATTGQGALLATQAATAGLGPIAAAALTPAEGYIGRKLVNQVLPDDMQQNAADPITLGLEAAGGGFAGLGVKFGRGELEAKIRAQKAAAQAAEAAKYTPPADLEEGLVNTGDMDFDEGQKAYVKAAKAANDPDLAAKIPDYGEKGQMDLELPQPKEETARIGDLFNTNTKDAAAIEQAREFGARAQLLPEANRLAQQGLLPDVTDVPVGELPQQRSPLEQNMLENVAERQGQLPPRAPEDQVPSLDLFGDQGSPQMSLGDLPQGQPARVAAATQPPVDNITQSEAAPPPVQAGTNAPEVPPLAPTKVQISQDLDNLRNQNVMLGNGKIGRSSQAPLSVLQKFRAGTLTSGDIFDSIVGNHDNMYEKAPQLRAMIDQLNTHAQRIGGREVAQVMYDPNNPVHQEMVQSAMADPEFASRMNSPDNKPPATYFSRNRTVLHFDPSDSFDMATGVHEAAHGVTQRYIDAGEAGKLTGDAQGAYQTFKQLSDAVSQKINDTYGEYSNDNARYENYGATNPHEFVAEMYGNSAFRNALKKIGLDDLNLKGFQRLALGKVRNAYDATIRLFRQMMGLNPKAENAFDAMFTAHDQFLSKVNPEDVGLKVGSSLNAPSGPADLAEPPALRRARGPIESTIRGLLGAKGNVPEVANANEIAIGLSNEGKAEAQALVNAAKTYGKNIDPELIRQVIKNDNAPQAMAQIRQQSPKFADALNQFRQNRHNRSIALGEVVRDNPNATPKDLAWAGAAIKHHLDYTTDSYAVDTIKDYGKQLFNRAENGDQEAQSTIAGAKNYLAQRWLNPDLSELNMSQLGDQYRQWTKLDPNAKFEGMSQADKRTAMSQAVAEAQSKIANKGQWLDTAVREIAGMNKEDLSGLAQYYKNQRLDSGVMSTKEGVPPPLAKLMGKVEDPMTQAALTIQKQASALGQLRAQQELRAQGLQNGLFTDKAGTPSHTIQLSGEKLGPLQGLYTTPDVARAINSQLVTDLGTDRLMDMVVMDHTGKLLQNKAATVAGETIKKAAQINKANVILGNPGNPLMDFFGSPLELASNGNIDPRTWAKGMKTAINGLLLDRRTSVDPEVARMLRLNVSDASPVQDLQSSPHAVQLKEALRRLGQYSNPMGAIKAVAKQLALPLDAYRDLYGLTHAWAKYANFYNEHAFWEPRLSQQGMTPDQIDRFVANRINATNVTPSHSSLISKAWDRIGGGMLTKYYEQTIRNPIANLGMGTADVAQGVKSGDVGLMLHGAKRMGGTLGYLFKANAVLGKTAGAVLGLAGLAYHMLDKNDPRQAYIDKDQFLRAGEQAIVSDPAHPDSGESTFNYDRPNPFGPAVQVNRRLMNGIMAYANGDKKNGAEQIQIALDNIKDMTYSNSLWNKAARIITGKNPTIAVTAKDTYDKALAAGQDYTSIANINRGVNALSVVTPSVIQHAISGDQTPGSSVALKRLNQAGLSARPFNPGQDLQKYLGYQMNNDVKDARKPVTDLLEADTPASPKAIERRFTEGMQALVEPYEKMKAAVDAAKAQGLSQREVGMLLLKSGVSKDIAGMLYNDKPIPALMMFHNPEEGIVKKIKDAPQEDRDRLVAQAQAKLAAYKDIAIKYKDVTMDQLENGNGIQ